MVTVVQNSPLCSIPTEILERIVLEVILSTPLGPPSDLIPILSTCKHIHDVLRMENNPSLYARTFMGLFDLGAARRRFGPRGIHSSHLVDQLTLYCATLQDIRDGDIYSEDLAHTLWTAFFMMMENDGKNRAQLEWAGLDNFINRRVRIMLYEGRGEFRGWPAESEENALALWLMVMTIDEDKLRLEDNRSRDEMMALLRPYVIAGCRYPSALAPANHFNLPLLGKIEEQLDHSVLTAHGPYPHYRNPSEIIYRPTHYGHSLAVGVPLLSAAAKILYFTRRQLRPFTVPNALPVNRAHALQLNVTAIGPTQADIIECNAFKSVQYPPKTKWDWWADLTEEELALEGEGIWHHKLKANSARYDHDWARLISCIDPWSITEVRGPVFQYGSLHGLWNGRLVVPSGLEYTTLITTADFPLDFFDHSNASTISNTIPIYMRLQEHHCISPQVPVPAGGKNDAFDDGLRNAYFPNVQLEHKPGYIEIKDRNAVVSRYETYVPGQPNSHNEDTCLVCIKIREAENAETRRKINSFTYAESVFERMGVGAGSGQGSSVDDGEDEDYVVGTCNGIQDIIVTGSTDLCHGQAWSHYLFYGRVRTWDGLIVILRVPRFAQGGWVFTGYLVGGQNLVGNWRATEQDVGVPAWEGPFVMSRRDD